MPELPEIEHARRVAEKVCVGRTVTRVKCADDPIVIVDVTPAQVRRTLTGRRILGVHRRGKYMWLRLEGAPSMLLHFGMTGSLRVPNTPGLRLAGALWPPADEWPPRFSKPELHFDDGGRIAWTNARRLGRLRLVEDPEREPPVADLGFDPLLDPPPLSEFRRLLARRRAPIKAVLLDQGFSAGVGNWVADEVLYQARLDPRRLASELPADEGKRLLAALRRRRKHDSVAPMTQFGHRAVVCAVGLALGVAAACAGKRGATKDPDHCMRKCDQDNCAFVAQGVSDNADYLECLRECEDECNIGGDEAEAE